MQSSLQLFDISAVSVELPKQVSGHFYPRNTDAFNSLIFWGDEAEVQLIAFLNALALCNKEFWGVLEMLLLSPSNIL